MGVNNLPANTAQQIFNLERRIRALEAMLGSGSGGGSVGIGGNLNYRGPWQTEVTYSKNDVVNWAGNEYICTTDGTVSLTPTFVGKAKTHAAGLLLLPPGSTVDDVVYVATARVRPYGGPSLDPVNIPAVSDMIISTGNDVPELSNFISTGMAIAVADADMIANGIDVPAQDADDFTTFLYVFRGTPSNYDPYPTGYVNGREAPIYLGVFGFSLQGVGTVTANDPPLTRDVDSFVSSANYGAAIGYTYRSDQSLDDSPQAPLFFITDAGGSGVSGDNFASVAVAVMPTVHPATISPAPPWKLLADAVLGGDASAANPYDTIALGQQTRVFESGSGSIVVGPFSKSGGGTSVVIGTRAESYGGTAIVIGYRAQVFGDAGPGQQSYKNIVIGSEAYSTGHENVILGDGANATGGKNVSIGALAEADDDESTAVGSGAFAQHGGTALGKNATATTDEVGIGESASTVRIPGILVGAAGTTAKATLRVPHGVAPTSPVDGDIWTDTTGLFVRINGVTVGPLT